MSGANLQNPPNPQHGLNPALKSKPARHIFLVSDGRSCSTWFASLLNHGCHFSYYFEPLENGFLPNLAGEKKIPYLDSKRLSEHSYGRFGKVLRKGRSLLRLNYCLKDPDGVILYARPGHLSEGHREFYASVFRNEWSSARSGPWYADSPSTLVKDVSALLLAKAISQEMPSVDVVCLIRNPVEVASSKLALNNWGWFREPVQLLANSQLTHDWLMPFAGEIRQAKTQFQKYVVLWAIMHHVVMQQFEGRNITYVRCHDDPTQIKKKVSHIINRSLSVAVDDAKYEQALTARSPTDRPKGVQLYRPTRSEIDYAAAIIKSFGLAELLDFSDSLPARK